MTFTMSEDEFQKLIAKWLDAALPEKSLWHHSPNEGKRHVAYTKRLIDLGMKPGFPDIEIFVHQQFWWDGIASPIFVEVKAPGKGRLTDKQKQIQDQLLELGCAVATIDKLSQLKFFLGNMIELRSNPRTDMAEKYANQVGAL